MLGLLAVHVRIIFQPERFIFTREKKFFSTARLLGLVLVGVIGVTLLGQKCLPHVKRKSPAKRLCYLYLGRNACHTSNVSLE